MKHTSLGRPRLAAALLLASLTMAWSPALQAQSDDEEVEDVDADEEAAADEPARPSGEVPAGASENPEAPPEFGQEGPRKDEPAGPPPPPTYPIEVVLRPLTLPEGMSELSSDTQLNLSPVFANELLRGKYGITDQIEVGLRYNIGALDEADGFTAGKTVSLDAQYQVFPFLAAQLSLPILVDPFAMGVTVGVPIKLRLGNKLALLFGRDLVSLRIRGFVPVVEDPLATQALIVARDARTIMPRGDVRLLGGFIYQLEPNLALTGELGVLANDFRLTDAGVPLTATLLYSRSNKLDLGARLGFGDLDEADSTFGLTFLLAARL